ncbi:MAG: hypothetical protein ACK5O2_02025 [Microthrixaceae bacterium]
MTIGMDRRSVGSHRLEMNRLDRLRTLTALVHSTPGATLHLECTSGPVIVAGTHQAADLSPCQLRQMVGGALRHDGFDLARRISAMSVGGTLEPAGPGIFEDRGGPSPVKRMASLLEPDLVAQALAEVSSDSACASHLEAHIGGDRLLGVSCVEVRLGDVAAADQLGPGAVEAWDGLDSDRVLDHGARAAAAAILVRECEALSGTGSALPH